MVDPSADPSSSSEAGSDDRARRIEDAFLKLKIRPDKRHLLPSLVSLLLTVDPSPVVTANRRFRQASSATSRNQLIKLAEAAEALAAASGELFQPAIFALSRLGILDLELIESARRLADMARRAASEVPDFKVGRPPDRRARAVATIVAYAYRQLAGESEIRVSKRKAVLNAKLDKQVRAYGPFVKLLASVFAELSIDAGAEQFAAEAANNIKRANQAKTAFVGEKSAPN